MKKFQIYFFILITNFSCTNNYFHSSQMKIQSDDPTLQKIKLGIPLDSVEIYLFGDYFTFDEEKENIWIENKDFSKLLYHTLRTKPDKQVLFTFNNLSEFNNMFGFYYEGMDLSLIKNSFKETEYYKSEKGITYFYPFESYEISDSFLEKGNGILRIITLNNPFYEKDSLGVHYYREINQLLFQLNKDLLGELDNEDIIFSTPYGNYLKYLNAQTDTTAYGKQIKSTALSFIGDLETRNMMIANLFQYQSRKPFEI